MARGGKKGDLTNDRIPKDNNTSLEAVGQDGSQLPMFRNFIAKLIHTLRVSTGLHETDNERLKMLDEPKTLEEVSRTEIPLQF